MILTSKTYPILPLRDIVIFPYMIAPLFVGRLKSINALETVMEENTEIVLLTQKKSSTEDPIDKDLIIDGVSISKERNYLEPSISPTSGIIKSISSTCFHKSELICAEHPVKIIFLFE